MNQFFAKKSLKVLLEDMAGDNRLKRVLGPVTLTALGVGAVIGAGIFVATGEAAHHTAGPALMLSYVVAGITCIFAALCYAEFASMAPVAGSAYTYAYCPLGELFAWIIGWDLVLEYAVGAATVANGWSSYFQEVIGQFGFHIPDQLNKSVLVYMKTTGKFEVTGAYVNLPAVLIVAIISAVLVKGIQESAGFNAVMVFIKLFAVVFVILVGAFYVNPENWHPFAPYGWTGIGIFGHTLVGQSTPAGEPLGMIAGSALIFFAYIGFDSVSTHAEEAKNPQRDVPIGIIASLLICTVLYVGVVAVLTGMVKYDEIDVHAGVSKAFESVGLPKAQLLIAAAGVAGITSVLLVDDAQCAACFSGHGARWIASIELLRRGSSAVSDAVEKYDSRRLVCHHHGRFSPHRFPAALDQHRYIIRILHRLCSGPDHAENQPRSCPPVPLSFRASGSNSGNHCLPDIDVSPLGQLGAKTSMWHVIPRIGTTN